MRNNKGQFVKGNTPPFKGKKMPDKIRKKMSESRKEFFKNGGEIWNKDIKGLIKPNSGSFIKTDKKFSGNMAEYKSLHIKIRKKYGNPKICMMCRTKDKLEWANKSGNYLEDRDDWLSLCYKCHFVYDLTERRREKNENSNMKGIFFRGGMNQNYIPEILKEIYRDKVYEPYLKGKKDLVIIDAGANISLFSQYATPMAKVIYSIEPSQEHFDCILKTKSFNKNSKIFPVKVALSNKNGKAKFYHNANTTMYSLNEAVSQGEFEEVETITLDKFFKENNIEHVDFLKVDIEGAEAKVFGSDAFDKVKDKIDVIMGEYHTWCGINPNQFASYFRDRGFKFNWANKTEASLFIAERIK